MVVLSQFFSSVVGKIISLIFWLGGIGTALVWIFWLVGALNIDQTFGLLLISSAIFLIFLSARSFIGFFLKDPEITTPAEFLNIINSGRDANIINTFSLPLSKALLPVLSKSENITSTEVLKALSTSSASNFIFARLGVGHQDFADFVGKSNSRVAVDFSHIAERSLSISIKENHNQIEVGDMLVALSETDPIFSSFISNLDVTFGDLQNIVYWQTESAKKFEKSRSFLDPSNLHLTGGIGRDWAFGYTPELNQFATDLTQSIENNGLGLEIIGHDRQIKMLEEILNQATGANAVLVGEPGVGKKTTVFGLAKKLSEGTTLPNLAHKHIMELDIDALISGLSGSGEFTARLTQVLSQAGNAGNVIIFIDGLEKILSSGETGTIDATPILESYLGYPEINFIGTIDSSSYNNLIAANSALIQHFEKIDVTEPTDAEMIRILEDTAPAVENHYGVLVTYPALKKIVELSKKYLLDRPNPEKGISVLEAAAGQDPTGGDRVIDAEEIENYLSAKTGIPVREAVGKERETLINLEAELHKRVVSQNQAIAEVAGALRRARAGVGESQKPIGSFLFLGPTGVGKTETAKALSAIYFGSESAMIRFDMSEYQNKEDVYRLIGSPAGSGEKIEGELTAEVRQKPFSLVLFDEIEKASPDILNLLLSVLDEGYIMSSAGKKVYFKNTIIIATSNAGANLIRALTAKKTEYALAQKTLVDYIQNANIFKPEFLNRFSSVIYFSPLSEPEIFEVAKMMIKNLAAELLRDKGIILKVEIAAVEKLAHLGYDPEMGARPMQRVVTEQIENFLAGKILSGEIAKGSEVVFGVRDIK